MDTALYTVKMRASRDGAHVSGAERIVAASEIAATCEALTQRAMSHPKGTPDDINVSVSRIDSREIVHVPFLPVRERACGGPEEAKAIVVEELAPHTAHADAIWSMLVNARDLRGAILVDAKSGQRLEPDRARGVRATNMDAAGGLAPSAAGKDTVSEARILAAKVAHHPDVIAEVCISDDPDYTTGYLTTTSGGYVRIPNMKEPGSPVGARVFVVTGNDTPGLIHYLEHTPVLVGEAQ